MDIITITNNKLKAEIHLLGAEIRSIKNITSNHEYMWSGNPEVWSGVSPVLFPVVGKTTSDRVKFKDKEYPLGNHGFARHSIFKVVTQTDSEVSLSIKTNELGTDVYPFSLEFIVNYTLTDNLLTVTYTINNLDTKNAYFSVGAHPAFKCPFDSTHTLEDYQIEFSGKETLNCHKLDGNAFFTSSEIVNISKIPLSKETFINNALVYSGFIHSSVTLKETNSNKMIKMSFDGFPWLGLWAKPGAPYICLEPWCGHSDLLGFDGELDQKAGIEVVAALESWTRRYSIELGY